MPDSQTVKSPKVIIAGAGLAGLTMAILLEKAGIEYQVLERSSEIQQTLGGAIILSFNVMPLMEQFGILDQIEAISFPIETTMIYKEDMEVIREINLRSNRKMVGYGTQVIPRPQLHAILLALVPKEKILVNKSIESLVQDTESVTVTCEDKSTYTADILIGADGSDSGTRRALYKDMEKDGITPKIIEEENKTLYMSVFGTTDPMDPANFEGLDDDCTRCDTVVGDERGLTYRTFIIPNNRVSWRVDFQSSEMDPEWVEGYKNADYKAFDLKKMPERWRGRELAMMGSLGILFDNTPQDKICKVVLEENIYENWKHGRTVLIGDAAHRLLPGFALEGILDAIVLANLIYEMPASNHKNITKAFDEFYDERFPSPRRELTPTQQATHVMFGRTWLDVAGRYLLLKLVPKYFKEKSRDYINYYRPQAAFLPRVETRGDNPPTPQRTSKKYANYLRTRGASGSSPTAAV
ncbi:hypothetical protein EC957_003036 [Mortierella hygrophila]|uniref:FAD-binding domain-containing protein n=1 Tax=Mortierella hygrophila TaxID=979708 RepID=A0A9P6F422_9FUNG|nr:hypothetical protein EC957_003036 [Mortierella hygrophila]